MRAPPSTGNIKESTRLHELLSKRKTHGIGPGVTGLGAEPNQREDQQCIIADWRELTRGDSVVLLNPRKEAVGGIVDDVSADGSVIWIQQDDCGGRRLFHRNDGYKTLLDAGAREE